MVAAGIEAVDCCDVVVSAIVLVAVVESPAQKVSLYRSHYIDIHIANIHERAQSKYRREHRVASRRRIRRK